MAKMLNWSDPKLVELLRSRDKSTLESLVIEYNSHLIKAAKGMRFQMEVCLDLANQTWIAFLESVHKFEGRSHIRTYLFGIFYNKCKEQLRSNLKFESSDEIDNIVDAQFDDRGHWNHRFKDPISHLEDSEFSKMLEQCINKLSEIMKQVFWLKEVEQFEPHEICHTLAISDTNLRQLLSRSKSRLRECLSRKMENNE